MLFAKRLLPSLLNIVAGRLGRNQCVKGVNLTNNSLGQSDNNGLLNFIIILQYDGDLDYIVY